VTPYAAFIKELRQRKGVSLKKFADDIGYCHTFISAVERGRKRKPTPQMIEGVITYFNLDKFEIKKLEYAVASSDTKFTLPVNTKAEVYYLMHELMSEINNVAEHEIEIMRILIRKKIRRYGDDNLYNY